MVAEGYHICSNKRSGRLFLSDCDPGAFIWEERLFKGGVYWLA